MSVDTPACCTPCPTQTPVNIPGIEGPAGTDGTNGTNGVNAYTTTSADFTLPLANANVTVSVLNSLWMTVGQTVVTAGPANFTVVSLPTPTSAILKFLSYAGDQAVGNTISAGSSVSPGGLQGPDATLLPSISAYAVAQSQALTADPAQLASLSLTLPSSGHYLIQATARVDYVGATFASAETIALKLRETTNGPADLANAVANLDTGTPTTLTQTFAIVTLPPVDYTAAANDTIQMFGSVSVVPGAGSVEIIEASLIAFKLF